MPKRVLQLERPDKKRMLQPRRIELINLAGDCCCLLAGWLAGCSSKKKNVFDLNKIKFFIILFKAFVDDDCWTCSECTKRRSMERHETGERIA